MIVRKLLFWTLPLIVLTTLLTSVSTVVGQVLRADAPELAYISTARANPANSQLVLLDVERRLKLPLLSHLTHTGPLAWSPDGSHLLFSTRISSEILARLMLFRLRDGQQRVVSPPDVDSYLPAWSPDGSQIAYVALVDGQWRLYRRDLPTLDDAEMGQPQQLGSGYPSVSGQLAWSPDGTLLAFQASDNININLYVVALSDGAVDERITNIGMFGPMSWLPDNQRLVFGAFSVVQSDIALFDSRDGSLDLLTQPPYFDTLPVLAPDGRTLAYSANTRRSTLYGLDIETGATWVIADLPGIDNYPVSWSPDGQWLAFTSSRQFRGHICIVRADGSGLRQVTFGTGQHLGVAWRP